MTLRGRDVPLLAQHSGLRGHHIGLRGHHLELSASAARFISGLNNGWHLLTNGQARGIGVPICSPSRDSSAKSSLPCGLAVVSSLSP